MVHRITFNDPECVEIDANSTAKNFSYAVFVSQKRLRVRNEETPEALTTSDHRSAAK